MLHNNNISPKKIFGSSYFRNDALIECKPISCHVCGNAMVRFDQNKYKVILTCSPCNLTVQMKTNEVILYKHEIEQNEKNKQMQDLQENIQKS